MASQLINLKQLQSAMTKIKSYVDAADGNLGTSIENNLASAKGYTDQKIAELINGAPETLDTLKEIADALGNDENLATTLTNLIATKLDETTFTQHKTDPAGHSLVVADSGQGTGDGHAGFMSAEQARKLAGIDEGAVAYVHDIGNGWDHLPPLPTDFSSGKEKFLIYKAREVVDDPQHSYAGEWIDNPNTDYRVQVTKENASKIYFTGAKAENTGAEFGTVLKMNEGIYAEANGNLYATDFHGHLAGKADEATTADNCTGNSASADKVNHSLDIQFNGTTAVQKFNGSADVTIDITPGNINAHTKEEVQGFVDTLNTKIDEQTTQATDLEVTNMLTTIFG